MIARVWRGATPKKNSDRYLAYLEETGVKECEATPGNCGVYVLRRVDEGGRVPVHFALGIVRGNQIVCRIGHRQGGVFPRRPRVSSGDGAARAALRGGGRVRGRVAQPLSGQRSHLKLPRSSGSKSAPARPRAVPDGALPWGRSGVLRFPRGHRESGDRGVSAQRGAAERGGARGDGAPRRPTALPDRGTAGRPAALRSGPLDRCARRLRVWFRLRLL